MHFLGQAYPVLDEVGSLMAQWWNELGILLTTLSWPC